MDALASLLRLLAGWEQEYAYCKLARPAAPLLCTVETELYAAAAIICLFAAAGTALWLREASAARPKPPARAPLAARAAPRRRLRPAEDDDLWW